MEMQNEELYAEFDVGKLYVWGVSLLIGFIGYSSQIFVFWDYLGGSSLKTFVVLAAFNFLLHLLYYNYYLAVTEAPGSVPLGWSPPRSGVNVYELKRDTAKPRYCRICKAFKPPRTHHCSDCERCVLKMDHHCPWTNNCVGYHNQAHFLRFVYTVDLTCAIALALHCMRMYELVKDSLNGTYYVRQPTQTEVAFLIINMTLLSIVLLFVGILSIYHVYLVARNTTTIESREKERVAKLVRAKRCRPAVYPYNLGLVRNFKSVFGDSILLWWLPKCMPGDGLDFPISDGLKPPVYWPPPGYTREVGDPARVTQRCEPSDTIFESSAHKVISEIDDDGEVVIRQYNTASVDDPIALESGLDGLEAAQNRYNPKKSRNVLTGTIENDKSDAGEFSDSFSDSDSDDDLEGVPLSGELQYRINGGHAKSFASGISVPGKGSMTQRRVNHATQAGRLADGDLGNQDDDNVPLLSIMKKRDERGNAL